LTKLSKHAILCRREQFADHFYRKEARKMKNTVFMQLSFAVAGVKYALLPELPDTLRAFGVG